MHYVLTYEVGSDYVERRGQFRKQHLAMAQESVARGELLLGGAFADPVDRTMLVFTDKHDAAAEEFAATDPYVLNGLVKKWYVRKWTTVVGLGCTPPQL
jgi:uncharacterized protein YciI